MLRVRLLKYVDWMLIPLCHNCNLDARPWGEVAALLGYSRWSVNSLRDMCQRGFDAIDSLGWERVVGGIGDAT